MILEKPAGEGLTPDQAEEAVGGAPVWRGGCLQSLPGEMKGASLPSQDKQEGLSPEDKQEGLSPEHMYKSEF